MLFGVACILQDRLRQGIAGAPCGLALLAGLGSVHASRASARVLYRTCRRRRPTSGRPRRAPHLGRAGRATAAKVAFNDRDFSGAIASSHTGAGAGTWYPPNLNRQLCNSAGTSDPITKPGPDGINLFQGALAYDPVLRNWTAPDAYAGNVGDSMSQKAYMWNRNNSFEYSDPSGYDA